MAQNQKAECPYHARVFQKQRNHIGPVSRLSSVKVNSLNITREGRKSSILPLLLQSFYACVWGFGDNPGCPLHSNPMKRFSEEKLLEAQVQVYQCESWERQGFLIWYF